MDVGFGSSNSRRYRKMAIKLFDDAAEVPASDFETMRQPLDSRPQFLHGRSLTQAGSDGQPVHPKLPPGHGHTLFLWNVTPEIRLGTEVYGGALKLPIVITENGISNSDWVALDGRVHDGPRIDYLHRHLRALRKAINEGADVRGIFNGPSSITSSGPSDTNTVLAWSIATSKHRSGRSKTPPIGIAKSSKRNGGSLSA